MNSVKKSINQEYKKGLVRLEELNICSNKLKDFENIIKFEGKLPLIIGQGTYPMVWIKARSIEDVWVDVVGKSESLHPAIGVIKDVSKRELTIVSGNITILHAVMHSDNGCTVDIIDLRPCGLNIHGTSDLLEVGNMKLKNSVFTNVGTMIAMGDGND